MDDFELTLQKQHFGRKTIKALGRRIRLPFRVRLGDIGRRIEFKKDGTVQLSELRVTADSHPFVHAICRTTNLHPVQHVIHRRYAIGDPSTEYEITPWFDTLLELEQYSRRHLGDYCPVSGMVQ